MGWGEYNQISGSSTTLNYIPAANLPSVRKNLLFNPAQPPHHHYQHHLSLFLSLTLQNDPLLLSPGHIQRENEYLTWERPTYPDGLSSTAKMRTKHSINISASLTDGMYVSPQSGNPTQEDPSICAHSFSPINRCRHTICIFMNCCAMFTQAAWSIGTFGASPKEPAILWPSAATDGLR